MDCQKLNIGKAFETIHGINEVYNQRLSQVKNRFKMDTDIYEVTCMEWVQMLQKYILTLIELIDDLFSEAESRADKLESKNRFYALQLSKCDCISKDYCSESFLSKSSNYSEAEKRLCGLHAEEKCCIDILNREIHALVEICGVYYNNMKLKEHQFSCQKDKIVKLVKSLMTRITTGHQRLSKLMKAVIGINELLSENSEDYVSESNIFQNLRSKVLEMRAENQCLKDQIQAFRSTSNSYQISIQKASCASNEINSKILKLECDLKMKNERVDRFRINIAQLQKELQKANCKRDKFESKFRCECEKVSSLLEENSKLARTLQRLREGDADREAQVDNLSQCLCEKDKEICDLKEENAALSESLNATNYNNNVKCNTAQKIHRKTVESLRCLQESKELDAVSKQEEICALEKMVVEKDMALEKLQEKLETKKKKLSCLETKLSNAEKELNASEEQVESYKDLLCKSQALNEEQMAENNALNDEISHLNSRICTMDSCIDALKKQLKECRANSPIRKQNDSLQCEISSLKSTIVDLTKTNETLKLRVKNFEETIKVAYNLNENQQQEICSLKDKLQKQVTRSNETVCKFDQLVEDYNEILEDHKKTAYKLECATEAIKIYKEKDASNTKQIADMEELLKCVTKLDMTQLLASNCELEKKINIISDENEKLKTENCSLERRNQALCRKLERCRCNS